MSGFEAGNFTSNVNTHPWVFLRGDFHSAILRATRGRVNAHAARVTFKTTRAMDAARDPIAGLVSEKVMHQNSPVWRRGMLALRLAGRAWRLLARGSAAILRNAGARILTALMISAAVVEVTASLILGGERAKRLNDMRAGLVVIREDREKQGEVEGIGHLEHSGLSRHYRPDSAIMHATKRGATQKMQPRVKKILSCARPIPRVSQIEKRAHNRHLSGRTTQRQEKQDLTRIATHLYPSRADLLEPCLQSFAPRRRAATCQPAKPIRNGNRSRHATAPRSLPATS